MRYLKVIFKKSITNLLTIYFIGIMIMMPYYNWQYAKDNGFVSWLLLGQIVPTFKALVFPYFIYQDYYKTNYQPLPEKFLKDRENFTKTKKLFYEAMEITKPPSSDIGIFKMDEKKEMELKYKLMEGIELSKSISDEFLDYLDPELKNMFRNKYVRGNELFLEGISTKGDSKKSLYLQIESTKLLSEFNDWWNIHSEQIINKAFHK
jgi:hypothetical protein